jgi:hypothetical protein
VRNVRRERDLLGWHERIEWQRVQQRIDERGIRQLERRVVVGERFFFREWIRRVDVELGEREHIERKR